MVRIYSQHAEKVVDLPDSEIQLLTQISENLNEEDIHLLFDMALKGGQDLMKAHDPRLVLEMVLLRMAQAPRIRELAARTSESHLSHSEKKPISNRPSVPPLAMSSTRPLQTKAEPTAHTLSVAQKSEIEKEESQEAMQTPQKSLFQENLTPQANWTLLVEQIKKHDPRIGAKLENVCLIEMTDRGLVLGVTESLRFLFDQLREPGFIKTLESDIIKFWEKPYSVSFTIYNPQKNTQTMSPKAAKEKEDTVKETSLREQVLKSDLVQKTQRVFNAEIEAIKEI
jgi:DNA polymerase-3 subunit gamma/tau